MLPSGANGKSRRKARLTQRLHQIRPDALQSAIAFVSVLGGQSFEVGFTLALFFADGAGVVNSAAGWVIPKASCTTGLAVGDATPTSDWRSIRSRRPSMPTCFWAPAKLGSAAAD